MTDDETLSAYLDGEIDPAARTALEARLEAEPALRARLDALRGADAALRAAYAGAAAEAEDAASRFKVPAPAGRVSWLLLPVAAAAGIAAGIWLHSPGTGQPGTGIPDTPPPPTPVVGMITLATGSLDRDMSFPRPTAGTDRLIHMGESLSVPDGVRASITLTDGTEVRLDRGSQVTFGDGRRLDVLGGRVWARVARGDPFLLSAGETKVTVLGTELSVARTPNTTEVQLFSGKARVEAAGAVRDLAAGQEVEWSDGKLSDPRRIRSEAIATGWMLELWAYAGGHDRDLALHMDRLLVEMGYRKAATIEESVLVNELSGTCRIPLARFLVSETARLETEPRRKAARVLERIADESVAPPLAQALRDPDAEVRVSAARALHRISGGTVCATPEAFRASVVEEEARNAEAWALQRPRPPGAK